MSLQNISKTRSQALLQEAVAKREQASEMLSRAGQQESVSMAAQVQQLDLDVQRLLQNAADSEMQAKRLLTQNAALQLGDAARSCSPVANKMSSEELLSASQLNANLSYAVNSTRNEQVTSRFTHRGATVKANVSLIGEPPPATKDFGMDKFNPKGKVGIQSGQCTDKDNCNFRGICKDGICYCQKNYYGPTCGTLREKQTGNVRMAAVLVIAVGCTLFSFMFTLCCLNYTAAQRRNAESKLGYVV
jgi:hypothetical protein